MVNAQALKVVQAIPPASIKDNAAFAALPIDCTGYEYCTVVCQLGATDVAAVTLKLQECDTSGGSYADVSGCTFGTDTNTDGDTSALPSATDDNGFFCWEVDLRHRKPFLKIVATAGDGAAGTYLSAFALLSRGHETPMTAAQRGLTEALRV